MSYEFADQRALIVGFGSIGRRHYRILNGFGMDVAVVSSQTNLPVATFDGVLEAMTRHRPVYVVIASPTTRHMDDLASVRSLGFTGPVLVEKPLAATITEFEGHSTDGTFVGYNLRFHPAVEALHDQLHGCRVLAVHASAG